jgi:group I intron endonuclease
MFYNLMTKEFYIGSSVNLLYRYRAHITLSKTSTLPLYRAIRKYGLNNFAFIVLEYCEAIESTCLRLEQNYIDLYQPTYNILKIAGTSYKFKHSLETISKLKALHSGELHPRFGTIPSEQHRKLTSIAMKKHFSLNTHHNKGKKGVLAPQYGVRGKEVHCYNSNGEYLFFPSINGARQNFQVRFNTIAFNIDTNKEIILRGSSWRLYSNQRSQ